MTTHNIQTLNYFPGQKATIYLETVDGYGLSADGYTTPFISRIVFPNLTLAANFPQNMIKLDVGLYYFQFTLPTNANAIGSYLVDVIYNDPEDGLNKHTLYQIIVTAPYGMYSAGIN